MRLDRGTVFLGIMVSLFIVLTLVLAIAVYNGVSTRNPVLYGYDAEPGSIVPPEIFPWLQSGSAAMSPGSDENSDNLPAFPGENSTGLLLGATPSSQEPYMDPLIGAWAEPSGDTYHFDGTLCWYNDYKDEAAPYYAHQETVWTHANTPYTTTIFSVDGSAGDGFGFMDNKLYYMSRGNTRWEVWWELTNVYRPSPLVGTWKTADGYQADWRYVFDDNYYYVIGPNFRYPGIPYKKMYAWVDVTDNNGKIVEEYYLPVYRLDVDNIPDYNRKGFTFVHGVLSPFGINYQSPDKYLARPELVRA